MKVKTIRSPGWPLSRKAATRPSRTASPLITQAAFLMDSDGLRSIRQRPAFARGLTTTASTRFSVHEASAAGAAAAAGERRRRAVDDDPYGPTLRSLDQTVVLVSFLRSALKLEPHLFKMNLGPSLSLPPQSFVPTAVMPAASRHWRSRSSR